MKRRLAVISRFPGQHSTSRSDSLTLEKKQTAVLFSSWPTRYAGCFILSPILVAQIALRESEQRSDMKLEAGMVRVH